MNELVLLPRKSDSRFVIYTNHIIKTLLGCIVVLYRKHEEHTGNRQGSTNTYTLLTVVCLKPKQEKILAFFVRCMHTFEIKFQHALFKYSLKFYITVVFPYICKTCNDHK